MTAPKATKKTAASRRTVDHDLTHYTPEQVVDPEGEFRLPTTARMLRKWAYERRIPHNGMGKRITFRRDQIRDISRMFDVAAVSTKNRTTAA